MAHLTFRDWPMGSTVSEYYDNAPVTMFAYDSYADTHEYTQGFTLYNAPVVKIAPVSQNIGAFYFKTIGIYLDPSFNDSGLCDWLPDGWTCERHMEWRPDGVPEYYPIIMPDRWYFRTKVQLAYHELKPDWEPYDDMERAIGRTFGRYWNEVKIKHQGRVAMRLDVSSPADMDIQFQTYGTGDGLSTILPERRVYDSKRKHLGTSLVHANPSDQDNTARRMVKEAENTPSNIYRPGFDGNLDPKHLRFCRKALGEGLDDGPRVVTGPTFTPGRRALFIDNDERIPFPRKLFYNPDGMGMLCLGIERGSDKLSEFDASDKANLLAKNYVMIHRRGKTHRFIFVEMSCIMFGVTLPSFIATLVPVAVEDSECAETAPLVAWRGLSRQTTMAINGNPYFASALQHAQNRRKYLMGLINPDAMQLHYPNKPILFRSSIGKHPLCGARGTTIGKRALREEGNMFARTLDRLTDFMGQTDLLIGPNTEVVQPVAADRPRRAMVLDS